MRLIRGIISGLAILLATSVGLVVLAAIVVVAIFASAQTDTGGNATLAGLDGPVSVVRDAHAVPHIFADTRLDAYRALGYVHAQDRFFQMEFMRRTAAGRLSEVIGPPGLRADRFMRTLGIYRLAETSIEQLSPEARAVINAYADGVNGWMSAPATKRPPEMIVLGLPFEPWRPADSAAWVRLMSILLSGDFRTELLRADLEHVLTRNQINDLWPDEPDDTSITLGQSLQLPRNFASLAAAIPDLFPRASASNEWVVSGERSMSGKPLLANDPHLGFGAPGMWHLARIVTPDFTASGGALPGQPFFMIGQNGNLSWGLTTTHADTQDVFIERSPSRGKYFVGNEPGDFHEGPYGLQEYDTRTEDIHVRWRSGPERLTVRTSRHGPIITDILNADRKRIPITGGSQETSLALAFAALRDDDRTAEAIYAMNSATTVEEFRAALRDFHAPMQNVVYAHRDGRFGFVTAGRLPIRPGGAGTRPFPGWTGDHDWTGFVPFDDLPQRHNPADDVIINANNRVAPRTYPHTISNDWPEGYRAQRINNLIADRERHSPESFAAIQNDIISLGARDLTAAMLDALPDDIHGQEVPTMMSGWDGSMDAARPEPLIYATWSHALRRHLMDDELGQFAERYRGVRPRVIIRILAERSAWCDNTRTDATETCSQIVGRSLEESLEELRSEYGRDIASWRWGNAHRAAFTNPLLRFTGPLGQLLAPTVETGGGDHTINRGTYRSVGNARFPHVHGPGLRAIFDMAEPDNARFMITPGQSGQIASPHYGDLADQWRDGHYIVLNGARDELRRTATSELTLTP